MIGKIIFVLVTVIFLVLFSACVERQVAGPEAQGRDLVPDEHENRIFGNVSDSPAVMSGKIGIQGLGTFSFDPQEVRTVREDIFREGHFSIFDILVHLEEKGEIEIDYYFDENMNTYVISDLNGHENWWYDAYYDGGWRERSVFRMDHYPYKDKMTINMVRQSGSYLDPIYETYLDEIRRKEENGGKTIIPEVIIKGQHETLVFENLEVKAYNLRSDMFQDGVITAIDTILTLGEDEKISYDLQWYESIGSAGLVKSYWVDRINNDVSYRRCGFVYEAGNWEFEFFRGNHVHIPSDIRAINSPEYLTYFWICI
ncbi:MAG: hypothetical protein QCH31_10435 [Methanolobus sp.]|nr:hypothetical protein [Methanolobus sp.]